MAILTPDDGRLAKTPEEAKVLQGAGYQKCYGDMGTKKAPDPCQFHIAPEAQSHIQTLGGYYTCPRCKQSHDLMHDLPWHGVQGDMFNQDTFSAGGGTKIGLPLKDQAQIGESFIESLGEIPGYGKITWVHPGGAIARSPLDMATDDWGIEIKTLGYDAMHHRFVPGREKEKRDKDEMAAARGLKGVLGLLVLLNYRNSLADVFARAYPVDLASGVGVGAFRSHNAEHILARHPFDNPLMNPSHPAPIVKSGPVDVTGEGMPF